MTEMLEPGSLPRSPGGVTWRGFWSALPDFLLAAQFLVMWIDPHVIGARFLPPRYSLPGEGEWTERPHTAIAFGFFYYAMVGWSELLGHRWFANVKTQSRRGGV